MSARKMTELRVPVQNQVGELARVLGLASQSGANVIAFCGYSHGAGSPAGEIMIVPDKPDKVQAALQKAGYNCEANPVVAIQGAAGKGMGASMAEKFSRAAVNILHSYASSTGTGNSTAIFRVEKPDQVLKLLKT